MIINQTFFQMKKILFAFLWVSASVAAMAQNTQPLSNDSLKMSLQDCIDYALKNSISVKNASLDEQLAGAKIGEIRAIGLPQISGAIGVQHNLRLRDSYFQASSTNPFTTEIVKASPESEGKILKFANFFQLKNNLDASLTATQILFSGSYIVGLQAANTYRELATKSTEATKIQVSNNVAKAYYMVLVNLERLNLFNTNILRVDSLLQNTIKLQKSGFVEKIDVMRLEVTLNNLITEREKFASIMILSNVLLKYQMGMPMEANFILTEKLAELSLDTNNVDVQKVNYNDRIEYKQLKVSKRLQELDLKNTKWAYLPSLVASANLGFFTSNTDLNFFSNNNYIGSNNKYFGWNNDGIWSRYGVIQVGLQVPIFDGFGRGYKVQQSKLNISKVENSIKNLENTIDVQLYSAVISLKNNVKTMQSQKLNMDLAKEVVTVTQKKYKQGMSSNLEVTTAESALKESQINYYSALYDALISKIDYEQAKGNTLIK